MRLSFSLIILLISFTSGFAQPKAKNFPNMLVFQADAQDPFIEFWFTGSMRKLETAMLATFRGDMDKKRVWETDSLRYTLTGITQPLLSGSSYTLKMEIVENSKNRNLIRIRVKNDNPEFNLLNPKMAIFRNVMEYVQAMVDDILRETYFDKDQNANTMYLFTPKESEKNLHSYLFMYSKEPMDSTMKKLSEWLVYSAEEPQAGIWLNDSIFRVDNLRQIAFGTKDAFSLTIEHSLVQNGYHQYVIYLSNFISDGDENNYQVRPYDIHIRLWRFYNAMLFTEYVH